METMETTHLTRVLALIRERGWKYRSCREDGCDSIDFEYRGVPYHIWEFCDGEWGVETNVRHGGRSEDLTGDYEEQLLEIMKDWR
ncbi:MAG: kinase [Eubacteriales bacterium]|nr:kinase [Eubacteriales bacterium]